MRASRLAMRALAIVFGVLALLGVPALSERLGQNPSTSNVLWSLFIAGHILASSGASIAVWRYSHWSPWLVAFVGVVLVVGRLIWQSPFGPDPPLFLARVTVELLLIFGVLVWFTARHVRAPAARHVAAADPD